MLHYSLLQHASTDKSAARLGTSRQQILKSVQTTFPKAEKARIISALKKQLSDAKTIIGGKTSKHYRVQLEADYRNRIVKRLKRGAESDGCDIKAILSTKEDPPVLPKTTKKKEPTAKQIVTQMKKVGKKLSPRKASVKAKSGE